MRKTAGYCVTGQTEGPEAKRYARIELSEKVCDSAGSGCAQCLAVSCKISQIQVPTMWSISRKIKRSWHGNSTACIIVPSSSRSCSGVPSVSEQSGCCPRVLDERNCYMRGLWSVSSLNRWLILIFMDFIIPAWLSAEQPENVSIATSVVVGPSKGSYGFLLLKEGCIPLLLIKLLQK